MGWLLGALGYTANQVQSQSSELAIVLLMTLVPAIFAFISLFFIWRYPLDKQQVDQMQLELAAKKAEAYS